MRNHAINDPLNDLQVAYGDSKELQSMGTTVNFKRIIKHPKYSQPSLFENENDIALIELAKPIKFSRGVQPACLGVTTVIGYPNPLSISGWGSDTVIDIDSKTHQATPFRNVNRLREGEVLDVTATHDACRNKADKLICTLNRISLTSSCIADSGGPLHANIGNG